VVRAADPDAVDLGCSDHLLDRREGACLADAERARERCRARGMLVVRAPDATDVGVPDAHPRLNVKAGDETAADEADSERSSRAHSYSPSYASAGEGSSTAGFLSLNARKKTTAQMTVNAQGTRKTPV